LTIIGIQSYDVSNIHDWSTRRASDLVASALTKAPNGTKVVELSNELRNYMKRNPDFQFAVIDMEDASLVPGSHSKLATEFVSLGNVNFHYSEFHKIDDANPNARGLARELETAVGRVRVVVYGSDFHFDDLLHQIWYHATDGPILTGYFSLMAIMAIVVQVVVRHSLAPVRAAAQRIARIDVNSLNQRISLAELPIEILPFAEAVNGALNRIDEGVIAQRRFIANAAHELRTPTTVLCAHVENPNKATFEHDIQRGVYRLRTIVEQLLSSVRLSSHGSEINTEVDLDKTALSVIMDYMPLAFESGRAIEFDCPQSPIKARANLQAVESILTNLVENAVRAEPIGGTVLVRVLPGPAIEIIDHGEGVAVEDRGSIFEPFWRKNDATPGTGLGLAITKELMDMHGGSIWVVETLGGGATFKLSFQSAPPK
jgi:signal transduction histidine kinase